MQRYKKKSHSHAEWEHKNCYLITSKIAVLGKREYILAEIGCDFLITP